MQRYSYIAIFVLALSGSPVHGQNTDDFPIVAGNILISGTPLDEYFAANAPDRSREEILRVLQDVAGENPLVGFSSLLERSLLADGENAALDQGHPECAAAYQQKVAWHENNSNQLPSSFGKIVEYRVDLLDPQNYWTGIMRLCSWIRRDFSEAKPTPDHYDEYYFILRFPFGAPNPLTAHHNSGIFDDPFPGTLDLSGWSPSARNAMFQAIKDRGFDHKMHAGSRSVDIVHAVRNGSERLLRGPAGAQDLLYEGEHATCVDMFLIDPPASSLPAAQHGYCMGRCDLAIINTY